MLITPRGLPLGSNYKCHFLSYGSENNENQKKRQNLAEKWTKKCHDLALTLIVNSSGHKQYFRYGKR